LKTILVYIYIILVSVKNRKISNEESKGWEFKISKRFGYELAKSTNMENYKETEHGKKMVIYIFLVVDKIQSVSPIFKNE